MNNWKKITLVYLSAVVLLIPVMVTDVAAARGGPGGGGGGGGGGPGGGGPGGGGGGGLTAVRVSGAVLVAADDPVWNSATAITVTLNFTDGGGGGGGNNSAVSVKAIHNGTDVAFLLSWTDATLNNVIDGVENFTDAGAIMLNANRIGQMGSPTNPTNIWYWRSVDDSVQNLLSGGRGTVTRRENAENISAISSWDGTQWQVVLSRPLAAIDPDDQLDLAPGGSYPVAFATWDGTNNERNGRKYRSGLNTLNIQN